MRDDELDDLRALVGPLLQSLDALTFVARYFSPQAYGQVMAAVGSPDAALRDALPRLDAWPDELSGVTERLKSAGEAALAGFDQLRAAPEEPDGLRAVSRALRQLPRAQEALYPLAEGLPPVSRFFLSPGARDDAALLARLADAPERDDTGVMHFGGEPGARGAWSMYVPEYYSPGRAWPLVVALHGGSGNGRAFLWSWLRDARAAGAILIAPTATGDTWALPGPDTDTPNLLRILEAARDRWRIDPRRMLLTGMSDGGTFSYVAGSTRLALHAPGAGLRGFHPMLAAMADPDRLGGLPIHLAHGALDWMFPVTVARGAYEALTDAGAKVTYRELDDLSHTYPRELNPEILAWMDGA